eukprot:jgi/Picre1/33401/NNA_008725.t1
MAQHQASMGGGQCLEGWCMAWPHPRGHSGGTGPEMKEKMKIERWAVSPRADLAAYGDFTRDSKFELPIREALIWADFGFGGNEGIPAVAGRPSFGGLKMADFGGSKSGPARSIWEARSVCPIAGRFALDDELSANEVCPILLVDIEIPTGQADP